MASAFALQVLYQLSYEDPYSGKQANLLSSSTRERNEHYSANAETTGSNAVEALKVFFFRAISQLLTL